MESHYQMKSDWKFETWKTSIITIQIIFNKKNVHVEKMQLK